MKKKRNYMFVRFWKAAHFLKLVHCFISAAAPFFVSQRRLRTFESRHTFFKLANSFQIQVSALFKSARMN